MKLAALFNRLPASTNWLGLLLIIASTITELSSIGATVTWVSFLFFLYGLHLCRFKFIKPTHEVSLLKVVTLYIVIMGDPIGLINDIFKAGLVQ